MGKRLRRYSMELARRELLNRGGLVVVGSRDRSEEDGEFARRIGEHCAKEDIAIISGAAKGIDREAMSGAVESGGWALGVLAEGLARTATSGQYRSGLVSDRLTLVSPYDPDSRWFAYAAMDRNKLLYGLGDAALVVASSAETGRYVGRGYGSTSARSCEGFRQIHGGTGSRKYEIAKQGRDSISSRNLGKIFGRCSLRRRKRMERCSLRPPSSPLQSKSPPTYRSKPTTPRRSPQKQARRQQFHRSQVWPSREQRQLRRQQQSNAFVTLTPSSLNRC